MSLQAYSHRTNYVAEEMGAHRFKPGRFTLYLRRNPEVLREIGEARKQKPPPSWNHIASYLREDQDLPERIDIKGKVMASFWSNQGVKELARLAARAPDGDNAAPFVRAVEV